VRNGTIYDGSGRPPFFGDVLVSGGRIVAVGQVPGATAGRKWTRTASRSRPASSNMLSWANESLIQDGRGLSDLKQGVTLEVFGEGWSMGPLNDAMKRPRSRSRATISITTWRGHARRYSTSSSSGCPNVASMVGAATVPSTRSARPIARRRRRSWRDEALVREAMEEGALGVGSALIYRARSYASTDG